MQMGKDAGQELTLAERVFLKNISDQTWPLVMLAELDSATRDELVQRLRPNAKDDKYSSTRKNCPTGHICANG